MEIRKQYKHAESILVTIQTPEMLIRFYHYSNGKITLIAKAIFSIIKVILASLCFMKKKNGINLCIKNMIYIFLMFLSN